MIGCHDAGRTVSGEPNIYSGSWLQAELFQGNQIYTVVLGFFQCVLQYSKK